MKLVIFGLTLSSSWGNGHATIWRALCKALVHRGHNIVFFEHDVPYYASNRDLTEMPGVNLQLYSSWTDICPRAMQHLSEADVGFVTSYCFDALPAADLLLSSSVKLKIFYDLDAPVTLSKLNSGRQVAYIGPNGLADFDLVLSFTGGRALRELQGFLGAKKTSVLYGCVDPDIHRRVRAHDSYRADLSYLGTYSEDRQSALSELFIEPARRSPGQVFRIGGAQYPPNFPWASNIYFVRHLPPSEHPAFYSSSRITLNVTRRPMVQMGYCPSGRLFEAAACGTPILSDHWEGIEEFFTPGEEILLAQNAEDTLWALHLSDRHLARIAQQARERTLEEHSGQKRASQLESILEAAAHPDHELQVQEK